MTKYKTKGGTLIKCNQCGSVEFKEGDLIAGSISYTCAKCGQVLYFTKNALKEA